MIDWRYISKKQYPKENIPVICVRPAATEDYPYALCIWAYNNWYSLPGETCYSDYFDQWAYLPQDFYKNPNICGAYDIRYSRCNGTQEFELCDCGGDRKKCNYY
jgi:hypothetical protein